MPAVLLQTAFLLGRAVRCVLLTCRQAGLGGPVMTSLNSAFGSTGHQQAWLGQGKRRQELCVSTARGLFWSTLRQRLGTIQSNLTFSI